jgi:hypothetical protein
LLQAHSRWVDAAAGEAQHPLLVPSPSGKKIAAPLAKPAVGAALAASFRRFPAANLHQRLASAAKR